MTTETLSLIQIFQNLWESFCQFWRTRDVWVYMSTYVESIPNESFAPATPTSLIEDIADPAQGTRWSEFDRTYRAAVFGLARRLGLNHHDAEDLTQDVFRDLLRNLVGFEVREQRGSFRSYLCKLIKWRVCSKFKQQNADARRTFAPGESETEASPLDSIAAETPPPNSEGEFTEAVNQAMLALASDLQPKHVQLLELYFCKEWPAKKVGEALGLCTATVFTVAHRHKFRLLREIMRRL